MVRTGTNPPLLPNENKNSNNTNDSLIPLQNDAVTTGTTRFHVLLLVGMVNLLVLRIILRFGSISLLGVVVVVVKSESCQLEAELMEDGDYRRTSVIQLTKNVVTTAKRSRPERVRTFATLDFVSPLFVARTQCTFESFLSFGNRPSSLLLLLLLL